ncbi:MAG: NAD(P)H-hydrate epimerase [Chloroflexi bacterium]|nr:NAD(P)H-hydrate epimerase [Chloroflexota bacterium]
MSSEKPHLQDERRRLPSPEGIPAYVPTIPPTIERSSLPLLTADQMRAVDRLMIEEYQILLIQMMENAGRNLADLAASMLGGSLAERAILVLAGRGNNGGGGLVAGRHLSNRGADVQVITASPFDAYSQIPAHQLQILLNMGVSVSPLEQGWALPAADLIIDAIVGYGLRGSPHGTVADLIRLANGHPAPVLALDAPSGLDTTSGVPYDPCVQASVTMTLALPKTGLLAAPSQIVGDLYLADISVPPELYDSLGLDIPPIFTAGPLLHIR